MVKTQLETIYETLLAVSGMHDLVKIDLKIPRKTVLLLTEVLRKGMDSSSNKSHSFGLAENLSQEAETDMTTIINESLEKAGLTELSEKLSSLRSRV